MGRKALAPDPLGDLLRHLVRRLVECRRNRRRSPVRRDGCLEAAGFDMRSALRRERPVILDDDDALLGALERLDATIVVPGQGPAFHDKAYLKLTGDLFASIISQVHGALERGLVTLTDGQAVVTADSIGRQYSPTATQPDPRSRALGSALVTKVHQEAFDGVSKP